MEILVNIYPWSGPRGGGGWCYAVFVEDTSHSAVGFQPCARLARAFDTSGVLPVRVRTEDAAIAWAEKTWPTAEVRAIEGF